MKRRWRKHAAILVVAPLAAWVTVGALLIEREPMPSFAFLGDHALGLRVEKNRKERILNRITRAVYSFEGDFNDVCSKAGGELSALGFVEDAQPQHEVNCREYLFKGDFPDELVRVSILNRHMLSEHATTSRAVFHFRPGWVSVVITRERGAPWRKTFYGPVRLLYRWGVLK